MKFEIFLILLLIGGTLAVDSLCAQYIDKFPGYTCSNPGISTPTTYNEWNLESILKKDAQFISKQLRFRDASDPKVKEKLLANAKFLKEQKLPFMLKVLEFYADEKWYVDIVDIDLYIPLKMHYGNMINEPSKKSMVKALLGLAEDLRYIHENNKIIANLRAEYLLQSPSDDSIILADFVEVAANGEKIDDRGDFRFWEPSRFENPPKPDTFDELIDVYSFGLVIYEMLNPKQPLPFAGTTREEVKASLAKGEIKFYAKNDVDLAYLAYRCLHFEHATRPTTDDMIHFLHILFENSKTSTLLKEDTVLSLTTVAPESFLGQITPEFRSEFDKNRAHDIQDANDLVVNNTPKEIYIYGIAGLVGLALFISLLVCCCKGKTEEQPAQDTTLKTGLEEGYLDGYASESENAGKPAGPEIAVA